MTRHHRIPLARALPWLVCLAAGGLGLAAGHYGDEPREAGNAAVSAARVLLAESVVPDCGPTLRTERDLVVVTGHFRRPDAMAVDAATISSGGGSWSVRRTAGICRVDGPGTSWEEPCLAESCQADVCAVRVAVPAPGPGPGEVAVRYGADGTAAGSGTAAYGASADGPPPDLSVARAGASVVVTSPGAREGGGRVTIIRSGRPVADVPLRPGPDGTTRLTAPPGTEAMAVAVSVPSGGGVSQSTVHLPGPFGPGCGPDGQAGVGTSTTSESSKP